MLWTSDAWSPSHLSKQTIVLYCRLSDFRLMHILCQRKLTSFRVHLFRWCWLQQQGHLCRFEMWLSTWMGFICGLSWWALHWNIRQFFHYLTLSLIILTSLDYVCLDDNDCNFHGICNDDTCNCENAWDSESDCSGNLFIYRDLATLLLVLGKSHATQILICKYIYSLNSLPN